MASEDKRTKSASELFEERLRNLERKKSTLNKNFPVKSSRASDKSKKVILLKKELLKKKGLSSVKPVLLDKKPAKKEVVKRPAPKLKKPIVAPKPTRITLIAIAVLGLLLLILIGIYLSYSLIPGRPKNIEVVVGNPNFGNRVSTEVLQFYPNMKFNNNNISYKVNQDCSDKKKETVIDAFNNLSDRIGTISFYESNKNPDIEILCSSENKPSSDMSFFIAGEGGAKKIIQTGRYNIISGGVILLYGKTEEFIRCSWPNIEIHELIHVLGFNHSKDKNSLMYSYLESCNQRLDDSIIDELKRLYSEENLPDLYFEDIRVVKRGIYLDFNLTVKNSGSIRADNVSFSILDNGKLVETNELGDIDYGAGISMKMENFKLIHRNPKEIKFIIDYKDKIKEIDEENNIIKIGL